MTPKRSLTSAVRGAAEAPPYNNKRQWLREQLGPKVDAELAKLLADKDLPPIHIWRELRGRGFPIPKGTVYRWADEART